MSTQPTVHCTVKRGKVKGTEPFAAVAFKDKVKKVYTPQNLIQYCGSTTEYIIFRISNRGLPSPK